MNQKKIQLSKHIANSGYCSRRSADILIKEGLVLLNKKIAKAGDRVSKKDIVSVNNKIIENKETFLYYILNKPKGFVCTHKSFKDEKNIFSLIKEEKKLFIAGRLDKDSQGLVLLTDNGDLINKLSHPKFLCEKIYLVKVAEHSVYFKTLKNEFLKGIKIEGKLAKVKNISQIKEYYYKIILTQGLNRQIRRMFKSFNIDILDLKRVAIKNILLKDLPLSKYRELTKEEKTQLLN